MRLVYRPAALPDLDRIYDHIRTDSPRRAASFVSEIRLGCRVLRDHPLIGPARDKVRPGLRIHPMFGRVVVCYRVSADAATIVRIFYGGQDYVAILGGSEDEA